jgi:hypothetical protein
VNCKNSVLNSTRALIVICEVIGAIRFIGLILCLDKNPYICKDAVKQGVPLFRVMSEDSACKSEEFKFPVSRPDDQAIPSGRPSVHCSIRLDDVSSRPNARQISIIHPDEVFIPSRPHTESRSFCASLHPSGRLPVLDLFLISFQVPRKGRSINCPDDVISRLDARLLKARIAIQI